MPRAEAQQRVDALRTEARAELARHNAVMEHIERRVDALAKELGVTWPDGLRPYQEPEPFTLPDPMMGPDGRLIQ